jgi:NAD(P)-dependent dehydrogenase (short-subunit alcohol dehydrogenase family)
VADVDAARMHRVVDAIRAAGGDAIGVQTNVAEAASVEALCARVGDAYGRIDILVNNAGIITDERPVTELTDEAWDRVMAVNLKGQFLCARAAARVMKTTAYGRIINVASRAWLGSRRLAHYSASKGGVISLTRSLALELGPHGITVNTISPTSVLTPLFYGMPADEQEQTRRKAASAPIPRLITPEDVAYAVLFFAGDDAGVITGQNVYVSGGVELMMSGIV